jgi:hypothetical protein
MTCWIMMVLKKVAGRMLIIYSSREWKNQWHLFYLQEGDWYQNSCGGRREGKGATRIYRQVPSLDGYGHDGK